MRVSFYTLGCKVNQNETGALMELFRQNGYTLAEDGQEADVYIVNSCTVTAGGDRKSRQWLRRAKRQNPGAITVLTGCYPQAFPEEAGAVAEADLVTGSANRHCILHDIQTVLTTGQRLVHITPHERGEAFEELPMEKFEGHTRAFLKVEDGCNRQCSYCVIPRARGLVRSRAIESVQEELRALAHSGYQEAVLAGINLSSYGKDTGSSLARLVQACAEVEGINRIRLGSLEPDLLTDDEIARLSTVDKFCPQFHLALQSGCDATLRRMRRTYTIQQYCEVADKLRKAFGPKNVSFTTDVIVGFPGETEEEFQTSMDFVRSFGFLKVHVFPYSSRPGTPAASFPGHLPEAEKASRSHRMQAAADAERDILAAEMEGMHEEVLLESALSGTTFTGYTRLYLPVVVRAPGHKSGDIVPVTVGKWDGQRSAAVPVQAGQP